MFILAAVCNTSGVTHGTQKKQNQQHLNTFSLKRPSSVFLWKRSRLFSESIVRFATSPYVRLQSSTFEAQRSAAVAAAYVAPLHDTNDTAVEREDERKHATH